jgi:hypothetical protein
MPRALAQKRHYPLHALHGPSLQLAFIALHVYSASLNCVVLPGQRRNRAYIKVMTAGMPRARACLLRARLVAAVFGVWLSVLMLAVLEKLAKWRVC